MSTGYKLLRNDYSSIRNVGRILYGPPGGDWITVPGHGAYVAVTGGLTAGGTSARLVCVECEDPIDTDHVPDGVTCYRRVRVVEELTHVELDDQTVEITAEGSHVYARKGSQVYAYKGSQVTAYEGSQVDAYEGSRVSAHQGSWVSALSGSSVYAHAGSSVTACSGSQVYAHQGSSVDRD